MPDGRCDATHCDSPNVETIHVEVHDDVGVRVHTRKLEFCPPHLAAFVAAVTQLDVDLAAIPLDPEA
jgi:hypothetical protein